jgi:hypothetical protein
MVGQAFVGLVGVEVVVEVVVVVRVVVIVWAGFGVEREVVRVVSRREIRVVVVVFVAVGPGQRERDGVVGRGAM